MSDRNARINATLVFFTLTGIAPLARADNPPDGAAAVTSVATPVPPPSPPPVPAEAGTVTVQTSPPAPNTVAADVNVNVNPSSSGSSETDVTEKEGKTYLFLGGRYRGYVIPKPFINIFVSGGAWVYSNSGGIELDVRKGGFSIIPNITYTEYSSGDMLFLQHGTSQNDPGNWSLVNSGIKVIYAGSDFLWSAKISKNVDFEYGMGFGLGYVFGQLEDNWVTPATANQTYINSAGQRVPALNGTAVSSSYNGPGGNGPTYFVPCQNDNPSGPGGGNGCAPGNHSTPSPPKVGTYFEPHGFQPVPNIFLNVSVPQLGIRIKPIKSFVMRLSVGFNIPNGFWFGASGDLGFESLFGRK
jgi:hypothetical protein